MSEGVAGILEFARTADLVKHLHPIGMHRDLTAAETPHCLREVLEALAQDLDPDEGSRHKVSWRIQILAALRRARHEFEAGH